MAYSFQEGELVEIHGLKNKKFKKLNGQVGKVVDPQVKGSNGSFRVAVEFNGKSISIAPKNLKSGIISTSKAKKYKKTDPDKCLHGGPPPSEIMVYLNHVQTILAIMNQGKPFDELVPILISYFRQNTFLLEDIVIQWFRAMSIDPFLDGQLAIFTKYFMMLCIAQGCKRMYEISPERFLRGHPFPDILHEMRDDISAPLHEQIAVMSDWSSCNCLKRRLCYGCRKICVHQIDFDTHGMYEDSMSEFRANSLKKKLFRCNGCHKAWFCSRTCQKRSWKDHEQECKAHKKKAETTRIRFL